MRNSRRFATGPRALAHCLTLTLSLALPLSSTRTAHAQETSESIAARQAFQETLKSYHTRIEDLEQSLQIIRAKQERIDRLEREVQSLREELKRVTERSVTSDQLRSLADSIKEVDSKRRSDNEKVLNELSKLAKQIADTPPPSPPPKPPALHTSPSTSSSEEKTPKPNIPDRGIEYVIKDGDTLSAIILQCRAQNIKVTQKMMMDANPDVKWNKLRVGQKIFIPIPPSP